MSVFHRKAGRMCHGIAVMLYGVAAFHGLGCDSATTPPPLRPEEMENYVIRGSVVSSVLQRPIANAEVTCYGLRGEEKSLRTGPDGTFALTLDDVYGWKTQLVARKAGDVSARFSITQNALQGCTLTLVSPAALDGTLSQQDGSPIADAVVRLVPRERWDSTLGQAVSDETGRYHIAAMPPGNYQLRVEHEAYHLMKAQESAAPPSVSLAHGETATLDFMLADNATVSGRILGPGGAPVPDLTFTIGNGAWNDPKVPVTTDQQGRFRTRLTPSIYDRSAVLESPTLGRGILQIPELAAGQNVEGLSGAMPGTARITGTVSDSAGHPLAGIDIAGAQTDDQGHYDTGWITLVEAGDLVRLNVAPPQWKIANRIPHARFTSPAAEPEMTYYAGQSLSVEATPGSTRVQDVVLEPIPLRRLSGTVRDSSGRPVSDAQVLVYQGYAITEHWMADLSPPRPAGPEPRIKNWSIQGPRGDATLLARQRTDRHGHWSARVPPGDLREGCLGSVVASRNEFFIAAGDARTEQVAFSHVTLESAPDDPATIDLTLDPVPSDRALIIRIESEAGDPVEGSEWILNCDYGYLRSDTDGQLLVLRISPSINLELVDRARCIREVNMVGTLDFVPPPQGAHGSPLPEEYRRTHCPPDLVKGYDPIVLSVEHDSDSVNLPFYDASQGFLVITLGTCER